MMMKMVLVEVMVLSIVKFVIVYSIWVKSEKIVVPVWVRWVQDCGLGLGTLGAPATEAHAVDSIEPTIHIAYIDTVCLST